MVGEDRELAPAEGFGDAAPLVRAEHNAVVAFEDHMIFEEDTGVLGDRIQRLTDG